MQRCSLILLLLFLAIPWAANAENVSFKRVLVTGGTGMIGSHLCERLLQEGHQVLCLDNLYSSSSDNIKHLMDHPNFYFIEHDVQEPFDPEIQLEEIYNLACPASPVQYQRDPIKTIKTNFFGALHMLELARKYDARIFQASTSEVYGDPLEHPQKETYWGHVNPIGIRSCYDEGKRVAETLFFDFHRQYGVKIKVGRIFNTYGPRMSAGDGRVVSNFIVQALQGQPITIYGDGSQTRSFCYIDDLIDAIEALMKSPEEFTGPVNLGNPDEFTVQKLAEMIVELTGTNCELAFKPLPQDDPRQRRPDISLAKKMLNWEPRVSLKEGLVKTINYFEAQVEMEKLNDSR